MSQRRQKPPRGADQESINEGIVLEYKRFGGVGRRGQFKDLMSHHHFEVVCLQETIKREFSDHMLSDLVNGQDFSWVWTEAKGHSRGTLTGIKNGNLEIIDTDKGAFFSSIKAKSRKDNLVWEVINVYGPIQNERKQDFRGAFK